MLARTAGDLFWLARYMERADYVARLLQVAGHMNAVRVDTNRSSEWESAIVASGCRESFNAAGDTPDEESVIRFLAFERGNPSSIVNCIETARRNARSVRTSLTTEMWEAVNQTSIELADFTQAPLDADGLAEFLDWVKARVSLFHGVCSNGMLRRDSFCFIRTGQFLERADNTARLLDVKYHVQLPDVSDVGGVVDYYQWLAILRVVGARRAYRVLFKGRVQPAHVAELLISRDVFPRSLAFCYEQITQHLDGIKAQDPKLASDAKRHAHAMYAHLRFANIDTVIEDGLHEYLTDVIDRTRDLGAEIAKGHLF
ncbi:alpha-E domain-containing protein [uncultured Arenimonas sp.]|uniref:alpha-E domain-containing protein n=1 Tax=uncultured Arenimonas sp. TaxID=546226 RepID=UPI0030D74A0D